MSCVLIVEDEKSIAHFISTILPANGWTWVTAVCVILFSLNHFPCATTLLTIRKETGSLLWTGLSFLLPTVVGVLLCIAVHLLALLVGIFF